MFPSEISTSNVPKIEVWELSSTFAFDSNMSTKRGSVMATLSKTRFIPWYAKPLPKLAFSDDIIWAVHTQQLLIPLTMRKTRVWTYVFPFKRLSNHICTPLCKSQVQSRASSRLRAIQTCTTCAYVVLPTLHFKPLQVRYFYVWISNRLARLKVLLKLTHVDILMSAP